MSQVTRDWSRPAAAIRLRAVVAGVAAALLLTGCAGQRAGDWVLEGDTAGGDPVVVPAGYRTNAPVRAMCFAGNAIYSAPGSQTAVELRRLGDSGTLLPPVELARGSSGVRALAAAADGRFWAAAASGTQVLEFDQSGARRELPPHPEGGFKVIALAWHAGTGRLWAVDRLGHRLLVWRPEHPDEAPVAIGGRGSAPGRFNFPVDVAVRTGGSVLVLDALNLRVQEFDAGGVFLRTWPAAGEEALERPVRIAAGVDGSVWVVDDGPGIVRRLEPPAQDLEEWPTAPPGCAGLTFDDHGRLWAASPLVGRVFVYAGLTDGIEHSQEGDDPPPATSLDR